MLVATQDRRGAFVKQRGDQPAFASVGRCTWVAYRKDAGCDEHKAGDCAGKAKHPRNANLREMDPEELVKRYLHGRNLEHLGRHDEAIAEYELAVAERFDSTGPYDRLIAIYADRSQHAEVVRITEAALAQVKTHADKTAWYERMREDAQRASEKVPRPVPKKN